MHPPSHRNGATECLARVHIWGSDSIIVLNRQYGPYPTILQNQQGQSRSFVSITGNCGDCLWDVESDPIYSARTMPARTIGLLFGQETLAVPDMRTKLEFQLPGLGFGFLPEPYARSAIAAGLLVEKEVEEPKPDETFYLAWRTGEEGAALKWWIERMRQNPSMERLLVGHLAG